MHPPAKALLQELIDYAGLFPPAKLPLDEAIRNYAAYRKSADVWMLGRFICPAQQLDQLQPQKALAFKEGDPFRFSVLLAGGNTSEEFLHNCEADLEAIARFQAFHEGRTTVEVMEVRLPKELLKNPDGKQLVTFLNKVSRLIDKNVDAPVTVYYESIYGRSWKAGLPIIVKALSDHGRRSGNSKFYRKPGFKIRCGGVEPQMYPGSEHIAATIIACRNQRVALKATAGLHHPLRHYNKAAKVKMHGFLNVFCAGVLAEAHDLDLELVKEIIEDENAENFIFTKRALAWRTLRVSTDEVRTLRLENVISFGSCSFDEPREDLRKLKII